MKLEDHLTPDRAEEYRSNWAAFEALGDRYRSDASLRAKVDSGNVAQELGELGISLPPGMSARIVVDTESTHHVVLPPDPNKALADETLGLVAGGKTAGSAGSAGSASSFACTTVPSSASSASTAGTVGTAS